MVIEIIVTGTKEGQEETTKTYNVQLPMDAEGTDAVSYLNNVLQWALGTGPKYIAVSHFKISGMHTKELTQDMRIRRAPLISLGIGTIDAIEEEGDTQ